MIKNFILDKLHNIDEYFKSYLEDISRVLQVRDDGGFEDPVKYYFSSKILENYSQTHRIYTGNTPKGGLVENLLFSNNSKPDLVAISNSTNSVEIFELKTIVSKPFLYSFMFSADGAEKNLIAKKVIIGNKKAEKSYHPIIRLIAVATYYSFIKKAKKILLKYGKIDLIQKFHQKISQLLKKISFILGKTLK